MKVAIVAVTRQGVAMAAKTASLLSADGSHEPVLYVPGKFSLLRIEGHRHPYRKPLAELMGELFSEYEGIICVMAMGIVVRMIAPYLRDKTRDPAVVVMDELGRNVVSVLSGHWGGANALAEHIANGLGANPVITTATDVHGLPAIDVLAREHGWAIEPFELVKKVNSAIVNGRRIVVYSEVPLDIEPVKNITVRDFAAYSPARREEGRVVLVTNRTSGSFPPGTLFLRPRNLWVGVGCRRGVSPDEIRTAVEKALEEAGRALSSVQGLASVDIKREEPGLRQAAAELNLPVEFFSRQAIREVWREYQEEFSHSGLVEEKIGVGGVCEPAAVLGAGQEAKLVLPKTKIGKVTVAVAEGNWL